MAKYRQDRINDSVVKEISQIIREVKDHAVSGAMITITAADVTPDLKYAKIYYSCITGEDKELAKGLKRAAGFVRGQLAKRLNLRATPEISFVYDSSVEHGIKIAEILSGLTFSDKEDEVSEE
ncbi:MAG: 30S ribosome-binding factor RbfA [Ruminococcaceae bacterium]|nr:30S ribosome-binding factor RbfA [Oscillospiraceae bacterium]